MVLMLMMSVLTFMTMMIHTDNDTNDDTNDDTDDDTDDGGRGGRSATPQASHGSVT